MRIKLIRKTASIISLILPLSSGASETFTRENGAPVGDNQNSQTAGETGPVLLQDSHLIEKLARFDRERIPERVVHARGTGAFGVFKSYGNFSDITIATPFQGKDKETKVFVRFSSVIHPKGSPETLRDPRGFATKFYTEQGNWDLVSNNLPIFFIRDAIKFPDVIHSLKPSPITNIQDVNRSFDFFAHVPESTNMLTYLYSDMGTPASYREIDGNSAHAYKFINMNGSVTYMKLRWKSLQGIKTLSTEEAEKIQAKDFNHMTNDLYSAISKNNFPSWELEGQILSQEKFAELDFNPLDATKEWIRIPGIKIVSLGKMTLNKVPDNFFETTEQVALAPSNLIPGIEPSEDRLLQGRLFSYADTQRHRLGVNSFQIPVNKPINTVHSHAQDGYLRNTNNQIDINYQPNSFNGNTDRSNGVFPVDGNYKLAQSSLDGKTQQEMIKKTLNFRQAGETYRSFSKSEKSALIKNFQKDLIKVKNEKVKLKIVAHLYLADQDYGERMSKAVNVNLAEVKKIAVTLNDDPKNIIK